MKFQFYFCLFCCYLIQITGDSVKAKTNVNDVPWSVRMAESVMQRKSNGYGDWDYVTGTVLRGFQELWIATGENRYFEYIKTTVDRAITSTGTIKDYKLTDYNIDEIKEGRLLLFLYEETGEEKYKTAAELLRSQLETHPRTSAGGFWHKERYPHQMWLDGLYMGSPFLAEYGEMFNKPEDIDDAVNQLILMETHTRDSATGLLYHGWDESKTQSWADPVNGCSPSFWGRAIGWYGMALVDVLDFVPMSHSGRDSVESILQRLVEAISKVQDDSTGVWWQVIDEGGRKDNYLESSVSCMLVYTIAKGIRFGIIDEKYREIAEKAYSGILNEFITENGDGTINLVKTCRTAGLGYGRDGSYDYYVNQTDISINDGKAIGPFITASLELEAMNTLIQGSNHGFIPKTLFLTNYPNPFNPITKITYSISHQGYMRLGIYNLLGQEVERLVDGIRPSGTFSRTYNGLTLGSGVYICRLQSGNEVETKRIVLLK